MIKTTSATTILCTLALLWGCAGNSVTGSADRSLPSTTGESSDELQYPQSLDLGDSVLTLYEPQLIDHEGYTQVTVWMAAVVDPKQGGTRTVGALKLSADMIADFDKRTVTLYKRRIDEAYFPELNQAESNRLVGKIKALARNEPRVMSLDTVLAYFAQGEALKRRAENFSMAPPEILYSDSPALLLQFGGTPVFKPLSSRGAFQYAVNTNWDVFRGEGRYFLLLGQHWIVAGDLEGPWQPSSAPAVADDLPKGERFARVRQALPGKPIAAAEIPRIFTTTEPTELIVTDGKPRLKPVAGTALSFVANSSQDIIYRKADRRYYLLLSGRWFQAGQISGPWSPVKTVPREFSAIPDDHPRAHVRAAVPGTDEAKTAVVAANIPTTAAVPRNTRAPKVTYSGNPKFEIIDGTSVARAVNTSFDVLRVADRYYLCHNGVWFESDRPTGPWIVADRVPNAIYDIPPDSPAHHVTYVRIYDTSDDEVLVGYTSGYHSTYVVSTTVVYGTGYYWPPYWYHYPYTGPWYWYDDDWYRYYPNPYTYGSASFYNPVTGTFRHGDYVYGPGGGYGTGESYNERTGRRSTSEYSWDYNSGQYSSHAYNPKRGTTFDTQQSYRYDSPNSYESWGGSTITKGDEWIKTTRYSNQDGRRTSFETSAGGKGGRVVAGDQSRSLIKTGEGDLYAGRNGEVYRRNEDGSWQKRQGGGWSDVDTSRFEPGREKLQELTPAKRESARQAISTRAESLTPAQREAARQRAQSSGGLGNRSVGGLHSSERPSSSLRPKSSRDLSSRTRPIDRRSYQQLDRSYRARSFGNSQFNRGGYGGRSFSGGGFSRGGVSRGGFGGGLRGGGLRSGGGRR